MSIPVPLEQLPAAITARDFAYVVTVSAGGRAHLLAVDVTVRGDDLVMDVGGSSLRNVTERPDVTLVFPPIAGGHGEHDAYSLVVDGSGAESDGRLVVRPGHAVLHRPAPPFTG